MKKISQSKDIRINLFNAGISFWLIAGSLLSNAPCHASETLDHRFLLETIGFIRPSDNIDGIFDEPLLAAYKDFFSHKSRFVINDLSQSDTLFKQSKLPYSQIIQDAEILGQLSRSTHTESIIRTKITKNGGTYQFILDWLHSPRMELIASSQFELKDSIDGSPLSPALIREVTSVYLTQLIEQVPFLGTVTGKDHHSATVNIGSREGVKAGDILLIGTLNAVKKHPILDTIVDWQITPTGRLKVDQVDEGMAFCSVIAEDNEQQIAQDQKILKIFLSELPTTPVPTEPSQTILQKIEVKKSSANLGRAAVGAFAGSYQWNFHSPAGATANSGTGFAFGGRGEIEVWLTREWFSNLELTGSFWNFTQQDIPTGNLSPASLIGGVPGSLSTFKFNFGYSYLITGQMQGPVAKVKLGFKSNSLSLPFDAAENTGQVSFRSIFLGVGGELPVVPQWDIFGDIRGIL